MKINCTFCVRRNEKCAQSIVCVVIAQSKMTEDNIPRMRVIWRTRTIVRIHHSMNV